MTDQTVTKDFTPVTKDFTRPRKEITFKLDDDIFTLQTRIGSIAMMDFYKKIEKLDKGNLEEAKDAMLGLMELVLVPESAKRWNGRMLSQIQPPIEITEAQEIITWIMEELGLRPTAPSENSSDSSDSPESGTKLMEPVSEEVLISTSSPSIAS